jgi:hypothetical protein
VGDALNKIGAMISPSARQFVIVFCSMLALTAMTPDVFSGDWPEDHTVLKNSTSPDGRLGVLVVSREAGLTDDRAGDNSTYLANLQAHQTIGKIEGVDYFEGQNHAGLAAYWAADSKACVVQYDARYGWESVFVLILKNDGFEQIDLGKHIEAIQKRIFDGYMSGYYRFTPDGKLKVRALSYTNPKQFPEEPTYNGLFQGTFDLKSEKWLSGDARKVKSDDWDNLERAYDDDFAKHMIVVAEGKDAPEDFTGSVFRTEDEKFDALDKQLNAVYQAVRLIVAPNRFAKVKQEQVTWLKTRDVAKAIEEKSQLTENRIETLQDLLW